MLCNVIYFSQLEVGAISPPPVNLSVLAPDFVGVPEPRHWEALQLSLLLSWNIEMAMPQRSSGQPTGEGEFLRRKEALANSWHQLPHTWVRLSWPFQLRTVSLVIPDKACRGMAQPTPRNMRNNKWWLFQSLGFEVVHHLAIVDEYRSLGTLIQYLSFLFSSIRCIVRALFFFFFFFPPRNLGKRIPYMDTSNS